MDEYKLKFQERLLIMAAEVIKYTSAFPETAEHQVIRKQLIRSVTSVGANYNACCRARSRADYINKLQIVEEECDESVYWMKLIARLGNFMIDERHRFLMDELNQVLSIIVASIKTMKSKGK